MLLEVLIRKKSCLMLFWFPISLLILCVRAQLFKSWPTLCDLMDCSPPGSSVLEILQAKVLEWMWCPSPGDIPHQGIEPTAPVSTALQADSLPTEPPGKQTHWFYSIHNGHIAQKLCNLYKKNFMPILRLSESVGHWEVSRVSIFDPMSVSSLCIW